MLICLAGLYSNRRNFTSFTKVPFTVNRNLLILTLYSRTEDVVVDIVHSACTRAWHLVSISSLLFLSAAIATARSGLTKQCQCLRLYSRRGGDILIGRAGC